MRNNPIRARELQFQRWQHLGANLPVSFEQTEYERFSQRYQYRTPDINGYPNECPDIFLHRML